MGASWGDMLQALAFAVALLLPSLAHSADLDIRLDRLGDLVREPDGNLRVDVDAGAFQNIVRDLGIAISPKFMGPASSLGSLGFAVSTEFSWTQVDAGAAHWQRALDAPNNTLTSMQIRVRKGLPYSIELGGTVTHLFDSSLWGVGLDLKFAVLEGFRYLPDIAFRFDVSTALGGRDLSMLVGAGNLLISKEFGLGGAVRLTPFAGYSLLWVHGSSQAVTFFADPAADNLCAGGPSASTTCSQLALFGDTNIAVHRAIVGLQLVAAHVTVGAEVAYANAAQSYTVHLGADF
jgi:hypothetical protein